jgi:hypothetical protein
MKLSKESDFRRQTEDALKKTEDRHDSDLYK